MDGTPDEEFKLDFGESPHNFLGIYSLVVLPNGKAIVAGGFTMVNGLSRMYVSRVDTESRQPRLDSTLTNGALTLFWPTNYSEFGLEQAEALLNGQWVPYSGSVEVKNGRFLVPAAVTGFSAFFRLKR